MKKKSIVDTDFKPIKVMSTDEYEAWRRRVLETDLP